MLRQILTGNFFVMDKEGGDGGGSGGGLDLGGDVTPPPGGGGGDNGGGDPPPPPVSDYKPLELPKDWKKTHIPKDYQKTVEPIQDFEGLVKSFANAQQAIGKDKIPIPGENATPEEIREAYIKLGLPATEDDYKIELENGEGISEEFLKEFQKKAHSLNIMPKQAKELLEWYHGNNQAKIQEMETQSKQNFEKEVKALKEEWGEGYDKNVYRAKLAIREYADDATLAKLQEAGLLKNTHLARVFAKIGETLDEKEIKGGGGSRLGNQLTPQEARNEIGKVMGDANHPYYKKDHPEHEYWTNRMLELQEMTG